MRTSEASSAVRQQSTLSQSLVHTGGVPSHARYLVRIAVKGHGRVTVEVLVGGEV
jgi:hypothetical protein